MGIGLSGIGGFDTTQIVRQLMYLERRAGRTLTEKKDTIDYRVQSFRSLNSKLASLATAAWGVYGKTDKFDQTFNPATVWGAVKGHSSNPAVTVSTEPGASIGSVEFDVKSLAQSKQVILNSNQLSSLVPAGGSLSIAVGNKVTNFMPASNSIQDVAKAINAVRDSGVSAAAVRVSDGVDGKGEYVLQITGKETGATAGDFKLFSGDVTKGLSVSPNTTTPDTASNSISYVFDNADALNQALGSGFTDLTVTRASSDAVISLYGNEHTYSSNNIELMDKVKVDISGVTQETNADGTPLYNDALAKNVKVEVVGDSSVAADKARALVDSVNGVMAMLSKGMKSVTKTGQDEDGKSYTWKAPGVLANATGRDIQGRLMDVFSSGVTIQGSNGTSKNYSLKDYGIDLALNDKELSVSFDKSKFEEMMAADPNGTEKVVTALAEKVAGVSSAISDSANGMLTKVIESEDKESEYFQSRIDDFDDRMIRKEASLKLQYAKLETLLANFSQQQSWLTSQLAGLSRNQ